MKKIILITLILFPIISFCQTLRNGFKTSSPSAIIHIGPSSSSPGGGSLKIDSGPLLSITEAGAIENDGTHLYYTPVAAGSRFQLDRSGWATTGTTTLTGPVTIAASGTNTVTFSGGPVTFGPTATLTGFNPGSLAGDPSSPNNGDIHYNSTSNALRARINGAWVSLGAGGGGGITNGALNNQVMISDGTNAIGNANFTFTGSQLTLSGNTLSSGTSQMLLVLGKAHTNQTASVAATDVVFDLSATMQYATGAITDLPSILVKPRTYSFVGASTVSVASSMEIAGYPIAGTNATMTKAAGLYINPTASTIPSTGTTYGLYVDSNGYTFYHAAAFNGKVLTIMTGTAPLNIGNGNSDPGSNNIDGDMYLNTTIGDLKIRTGGVHVPIVTFPKALSIAFLKL